jgi:hypothetical protein
MRRPDSPCGEVPKDKERSEKEKKKEERRAVRAFDPRGDAITPLALGIHQKRSANLVRSGVSKQSSQDSQVVFPI